MHDFSNFLYHRSSGQDCSDLDICRMAAFLIQNGTCYVCNRPLQEHKRQLHHRLPRQYGGKDTPGNLIYLDTRIHRAIHAETFEDFYMFLRDLEEPLTVEQLGMVNQLRVEARNQPFLPEKEEA